ncbi:Mitochondrial inner membrane protein oxa1l [Physocladia obscura]|uniref:Mitochondrial inner membrane protein oxa1l n=1 Tax=Physocladia obscura TaxID=109957 RepID=A0AAD5XCR6_9FUNG|nr:Mitochondrial inner membrane protein oxa1l [Physocladia obscura]
MITPRLTKSILAATVTTRPALLHKSLAGTRFFVPQTRSFLFSRPLIAQTTPTVPNASNTVSAASTASNFQNTTNAANLVANETNAIQTQTIAQIETPTLKLIDPSVSTEFTNALDTVITDIVDIPTTQITSIGDLHALGLGSYYSPVGLFENFLEAVYLTTGLPWWATIATTTVFIRIALLPFVVKSQRTGAMMANLKPLIAPIQTELKAAQASGDRGKQAAVVKKMQNVYRENGINPFGSFWGFIQMPVFMSMFFGLRAMADLPVPGFTTGGFLWFHDLSVMDPTYILPIVASGTMLLVMDVGMENQAAGNAGQMETMKNVFKGMIFISLPFTATMPAAVFMYWTTSNFLTLLQAHLLKDPSVRKALNIPKMKNFANPAPVKGLSSGVTPDGLLSVKPMKFGEAWKLTQDEAKRSIDIGFKDMPQENPIFCKIIMGRSAKFTKRLTKKEKDTLRVAGVKSEPSGYQHDTKATLKAAAKALGAKQAVRSASVKTTLGPSQKTDKESLPTTSATTNIPASRSLTPSNPPAKAAALAATGSRLLALAKSLKKQNSTAGTMDIDVVLNNPALSVQKQKKDYVTKDLPDYVDLMYSNNPKKLVQRTLAMQNLKNK